MLDEVRNEGCYTHGKNTSKQNIRREGHEHKDQFVKRAIMPFT